MGVTINTTETVTCDICRDYCEKDDGKIRIEVNNGDGRDVGPATIESELKFTQPYRVSNGIVCKKCKIKWLTRYIKQLTKQ